MFNPFLHVYNISAADSIKVKISKISMKVKLLNPVEAIVAKGEIALFLLSQWFESVCSWERDNRDTICKMSKSLCLLQNHLYQIFLRLCTMRERREMSGSARMIYVRSVHYKRKTWHVRFSYDLCEKYAWWEKGVK